MLNIKLRAVAILILLIFFLLGVIGFIINIYLPVWAFFAVIGTISLIISCITVGNYIYENPNATIKDFIYD